VPLADLVARRGLVVPFRPILHDREADAEIIGRHTTGA
jgi:hypothetical protein